MFCTCHQGLRIEVYFWLDMKLGTKVCCENVLVSYFLEVEEKRVALRLILGTLARLEGGQNWRGIVVSDRL